MHLRSLLLSFGAHLIFFHFPAIIVSRRFTNIAISSVVFSYDNEALTKFLAFILAESTGVDVAGTTLTSKQALPLLPSKCRSLTRSESKPSTAKVTMPH